MKLVAFYFFLLLLFFLFYFKKYILNLLTSLLFFLKVVFEFLKRKEENKIEKVIIYKTMITEIHIHLKSEKKFDVILIDDIRKEISKYCKNK